MGLFGLACSALSIYIWSLTLYNVYHPLRQNVLQAAPSFTPSALASALQRTISGSSSQQTPQTSRRGRKRKHLTLAEAQREELRDALKVLLIWLVCKGLEPVFDNTLGYVVPLYTVVKAIVLMVFARFRASLSMHLFDSFVAPLGRPNTPLVNASAFTAILFPALRFLLSLPFAHLTMAIKNYILPMVSSWTESRPSSAASSPVHQMNAKRLSGDSERIPPPQSFVQPRKASGSHLSHRDHRRGPDGGENGGDRAAGLLKSQRSMDSLASASSRLSDIARPRSVSSRITPGAQHTLSQLHALPSVPRQRPEPPTPLSVASNRSTSTAFSTFAHIPPLESTPLKRLPHDLVQPPTSMQAPKSHLPPMSHSLLSPSPRMPGFLGGQGRPEQPVNAIDVPNITIEKPNAASMGSDPDTTGVVHLAKDIESVDTTMTPTKGRQSKSTSAATKNATPRKGKRKAADMAQEDEGSLTTKAAKTRSPPGKQSRARGIGASMGQPSTAARSSSVRSTSEKSVSVEPQEGQAESESKTLMRSRSTRTVKAVRTTTEDSDKASSTNTARSTTTRARRKAVI